MFHIRSYTRIQEVHTRAHISGIPRSAMDVATLGTWRISKVGRRSATRWGE